MTAITLLFDLLSFIVGSGILAAIVFVLVKTSHKFQ